MTKADQKILETINEARKLAIDGKKPTLAVNLKQIMMKTFTGDAHRLLVKERAAKAANAPAPLTSGANKHYVSASGQDVSDIVESMKAPQSNEKKTKTVAVSTKGAMALIASKTYEALSAMNDIELDAVFGNVETEKKWLDDQGFKIHPRAGKEVTRKRTRFAFTEMQSEFPKDEEE